MNGFLQDKSLKHYRLLLERILRYRPYTLNDREEKYWYAGEMAQAAVKRFVNCRCRFEIWFRKKRTWRIGGAFTSNLYANAGFT